MKKHSGKTIVDIGNAVGVSHSTVSRALRNDPRISPETTRKVIQAAYALGYVQNARPGGCRTPQDNCSTARTDVPAPGPQIEARCNA